ncbi:MAG: M28 family peptidase [Mariniphaga sp.]|nr:M28 family peptidase [Mariniphaga sp.]
MSRLIVISVTLIFLFAFNGYSQLTPYYHWTLLPEDFQDEIIGEASGETALHHAIEMVGYQRNRPAEEYSTVFREGKYVLDKLIEYGITNAKIERFEGGKTWDGIKGELWEVSPNKVKLADYDDIVLMLAQGSKNTDVTAELVWVEEGTDKDLEGIDLEGKIVVTSSYVSRVHNRAVEKRALGVVAFGSSRELVAPLAIPASGIRGNNATFGFYLPPREGQILRDRLIRGEKIEVHAVVESEELDYDLQVPTCVIPGSNPDAGEIILSAHIFEGYVKQGANDNISGSAAILEVARMLNTMFEEGRLPRPERSIRFVWVPEYSGTAPWVAAHKDIMNKTLCNINLDMVGLHLKSNNSFLCMMRTTFGNPHYLNDVMENLYTFVGETNREILPNRSGQKIVNRIVAPSGTDDPFYYKIDVHYGASDHEVFNHWTTKVPGIMMITWPDLYYHTSEDLPNKLDPTQLKRTIVIAASAAYSIASAGEQEAITIAGEVFSNSQKRMGHQLARGMDELGRTDVENFAILYKKVKRYIDATWINEKNTILSVSELAPESSELESYLDGLVSALEMNYKANLEVMENHMKAVAIKLKVKPVKIELTQEEKDASKIIPKTTPKVAESEFSVERGTRTLSQEIRDKYPVNKVASTSELTKLINGENSVLDIKILLDAQNERESELEGIINYLHLMKEMGLVEI